MCYFRYCDVFSVRKYTNFWIWRRSADFTQRAAGSHGKRKRWRKKSWMFVRMPLKQNSKTYDGISEGRRIVKIWFLAEQLKSCQKCKTTPLHLKDRVGEIRYGFDSILKIKCICSHINTIYTGKQHRTEDKSDKGLKILDVNSKAALGKKITYYPFFLFFNITVNYATQFSSRHTYFSETVGGDLWFSVVHRRKYRYSTVP